jgi:hypothetical protein
MTAVELLTELGAIRTAFNWHITQQGRIRASLREDAANRAFDPITAVAYFRTNQFFSAGHWANAADAIGLAACDCAEIVAAFNYDWHPSCRQGALRNDLLNALMWQTEPVKASGKQISVANLFLRGVRKGSTPTSD